MRIPATATLARVSGDSRDQNTAELAAVIRTAWLPRSAFADLGSFALATRVV